VDSVIQPSNNRGQNSENSPWISSIALKWIVGGNRPCSYSRYWTGTSLQWRLMRGNIQKRASGCVSLRKSKIGFLNPWWRCSGGGFFGSFDAPWSERSWIDLFSKETQNPFSDSFGFKNPNLDFLKETNPQLQATILDKIKRNNYPPSPPPRPPSNEECAKEQKRAILVSLKWVEGWSRCSIYFVEDCRYSPITVRLLELTDEVKHI